MKSGVTVRGYALLPVAIMLAVVAAIALLANYESSLEANMAVSEQDAARAGYVAAAGLNHARWLLDRQGCGPFTDLGSRPLGADQYSGTLATDLGATASYVLPVAQDTWIDEKAPTSNYGTGVKLNVDLDGGFEAHTLLKYNLPALAPNAGILSATLYLQVDSGFPLGPHAVHRVTASWTESDATWSSVGAAIDEAALAVIPAQPASGTWVAVDLTAQMQAWSNGQPNDGIALVPQVANDKGKYASRESGQPSYLAVTVGAPPTPVATLKSAGTLANGVTHSISRDRVPLYQAPPGNMFRQPGITTGKDSFFLQGDPNFGDETFLRLGTLYSGFPEQSWVALQFDLGSIPPNAQIVSAQLELYQYQVPNGTSGEADVHRITSDWSELDVTWLKRTGPFNWTTAGGDYDPEVSARTMLDTLPGWYGWDIGKLVAGWARGDFPNYGVLIRSDEASLEYRDFYSSEHGASALRPKLTVVYRCECGVVCLPAQGSGKILFVVANASALTAREADYQRIFENMGYTVDYLSDHDAWWDFNNKAANNDVIFVSRNVDPGSWGLTSALAGTSLGLVVDKNTYVDDLGFGAAVDKSVGRELKALDTDHDITRIFPADALRIYDHDMRVRGVTGVAAGAQVLAQHGGVVTIVTLDAGADLGGSLVGQQAAGRRVMLPFVGGKNFNLAQVNNNGLLLLQRSLDWAKYQACTPQWSSWRVGASTDDAEERFGNVYLDSGDLELTVDSFLNQTVGIRFQNVGIPPGATIAEAYLDFTADETDSGATSVLFEGELAADAAPYAEINGNISGRARTIANVAWDNIPAWGVVGEVHTSPNISSLINEIINGPGWSAGNSMAFVITGSGTRTAEAYDGSPTQAPLLRVNFCGTLPDPQQLLMVVGNDWGLTAQEDAKQALFESWGYQVNLIDEDDTQADFDAAIAANDVVFVGEDVTAANLNTKLVGAGIGVVTEEANLADEFGFADAIVWGSGTDLNVGLQHHITETIGLGTRTILSVSESLAALAGATAPALQAIASTPDGVALAALDAGATMVSGGDTSGRRVFLPWGGDNMDVNHLNANGLTILRRALEWAGGAGVGDPTLPIAHWKLDETAGTTAVDSAGGNDGTLVNGPAWTPGVIDGALHFDGVDDYVDVGSFDVTGSGISLLAWFNADSFAVDDVRFISKANGTAKADAWWQLSTTRVGGNYLLRARFKAGGTTTVLLDNSTPLDPGQWYFAVATYDDGSGQMKLYLDGVEIASAPHDVGGIIDVDPSVPVSLGANSATDRFFNGLLDDVRVYDYALGAAKIADIYAESQPAPSGYVELHAPWSATAADTWEVVDLAGLGVPANAVVEVVIVNDSNNAQLWGGVRAIGSTLDRRLQLHEAEGGGVDAVTMHVQADANSSIEHYSGNTGNVSFILLGYWNGGSYVERFDSFTAGASGSWRDISLAAYGVGADQVAEVVAANSNTDNERYAGLRRNGSALSRLLALQEAESGGFDSGAIWVVTDASATIEAFAEVNTNIDFHLLGYWSTPPGTFTEAAVELPGAPASSGAWDNTDLSGLGLPADAVAQILLANTLIGAQTEMGVRRVGSSLGRVLDLHEAESGGNDVGTMHVVADSAARIEWYDEQAIGGPRFLLTGWWQLAP